MMYCKLALWGLLVQGSVCFRIGVDDSLAPYVCTRSDNDAPLPISWSSGTYARRLYDSAFIEVRAEGIRMVSYDASRYHSVPNGIATECVGAPRALCATPDNQSVVLPNWWPPIVSWVDDSPMTNKAVQTMASGSVCHNAGAGKGRRFVASQAPRYDVSLCDVTSGVNMLVYDVAQGVMIIVPRTLSYSAYVLFMGLAVVLLFGFTASRDTPPPLAALYIATAGTGLVCSVLQMTTHSAYYLCQEDRIYLTFTTCAGGAYVAAALYGHWNALSALSVSHDELIFGACLHTIDAVVVSVYNTPETPFSAMFAAVIAVRMWTRLLESLSDARHADVALILELALICTHGALMGELGVMPQIQHEALWNSTVQTTLFVTYVWAKCRKHSS